MQTNNTIKKDKEIFKKGFFGTSTNWIAEKQYYVTDLPSEDLSVFYSKEYYGDFYSKKTIKKLFKKILMFILGHPPHVKSSSDFLTYKPFLKTTKSFLEVGSGDGEMLKVASRYYDTVSSIEMDADQNKLLKEKYPNVHISNENFETKKIDEVYDTIYMRHSLEHVSDLGAVIDKLNKNISENGLVVINVPNCENKEILDLSIYHHPHIYHFTKNGLEKAFEEGGFDVLYSSHCTWKKVSKIERLLKQVLFKNNMMEGDSETSEHLFLVAKKTS